MVSSVSVCMRQDQVVLSCQCWAATTELWSCIFSTGMAVELPSMPVVGELSAVAAFATQSRTNELDLTSIHKVTKI